MVAPLCTSTPTASSAEASALQPVRHSRAHRHALARLRPATEVVTTPTRVPLSSADRLWLQLPNMVIHAALVFEESIARADVVELVRTRVLTMPRFRRRLVTDDKAGPYWEAAHKAPEDHIRFLRVPGSDGTAMMQAAVEKLKETPLDPAIAPWDMTLVHGDARASLLVTRIHHAVSDGRGLVEAIMRCDEKATEIAVPAEHTSAKLSKSPLESIKLLGGMLATACRLATRRSDPRSSIKPKQAVQGLAVTWLPVFWALDDVKRIAANYGGGTVNDVVLAAISGALRTYMLARGDKVEGVQMRCLLPFNLAATADASEPGESGNLVGGGLCNLAVQLGDRRQRFVHVHTAMNRLKHSIEPAVSGRMMSWFNNAPRWVRKPLHRFAASKCTVFVSNVVGPQQTMRVAGHPVKGILWFVPPLLNIGMGFPVISYEGKLCVGISADPHLVPDINNLQAILADEYQQMLAAL